jgi:hypothetical protein
MATRQTVQKKPATVIRTEIVRVTMPAAHRLGATEIATPDSGLCRRSIPMPSPDADAIPDDHRHSRWPAIPVKLAASLFAFSSET